MILPQISTTLYFTLAKIVYQIFDKIWKKQLYLDNQISSIHPKSQQPMEISTPNSQQFTFC